MTVYGIGIYTEGKYKSSIKRKMTKEYALWVSMLNRCYGAGVHLRVPTYKACEVSENFKNFQFFAEWCNQQVGFGNKGWELDKDLLIRGNKVYSEDTCVFIPRVINSSITEKTSSKLLGVTYDPITRGYKVWIYKEDGGRFHKVFDSREQAYLAYRESKLNYLKYLAELWRGVTDPRAYQSLINYDLNFKLEKTVDEPLQLMEDEVWIEGTDNKHTLTKSGNVTTIRRGRRFKQKGSIKKYGVCVTLRYNAGKECGVYIHRLVALRWVHNPNSFRRVRHIDGNIENNHYLNLEWY